MRASVLAKSRVDRKRCRIFRHTSGLSCETSMDDLSNLRRTRRWPTITTLVVLLAVATSGLLSLTWWRSSGPFAAIAILGAAAIAIVHRRKQRTRCPRCGRLYYRTLFYYNPFARRCVHCGLPRDAVWTGTREQVSQLGEWYLQGAGRGPIPDVGLCCPKCGYRLTGLPAPRCPECGHEVDLDQLFKDLS